MQRERLGAAVHPIACLLDDNAADVLILPVVAPLFTALGDRRPVATAHAADSSSAMLQRQGSSLELLPFSPAGSTAPERQPPTATNVDAASTAAPLQQPQAIFADVVARVAAAGPRAAGIGMSPQRPSGHRSGSDHTAHPASALSHKKRGGVVGVGSPQLRPSTLLITQTAAIVPRASPATLWITMSDDDGDDADDEGSNGQPQPPEEGQRRYDVDQEDDAAGSAIGSAASSANSRLGAQATFVRMSSGGTPRGAGVSSDNRREPTVEARSSDHRASLLPPSTHTNPAATTDDVILMRHYHGGRRADSVSEAPRRSGSVDPQKTQLLLPPLLGLPQTFRPRKGTSVVVSLAGPPSSVAFGSPTPATQQLGPSAGKAVAHREVINADDDDAAAANDFVSPLPASRKPRAQKVISLDETSSSDDDRAHRSKPTAGSSSSSSKKARLGVASLSPRGSTQRSSRPLEVPESAVSAAAPSASLSSTALAAASPIAPGVAAAVIALGRLDKGKALSMAGTQQPAFSAPAAVSSSSIATPVMLRTPCPPLPNLTDHSSTGAAHRKRLRIDDDRRAAAGSSSPLFGRPVDALRPLYPTVPFTKKIFMDGVAKVVSKEFCFKKNEFWSAFHQIQYVGEGSFGIVWRCTTQEGNVVAVKSCPISFQSGPHIDDGFSVLREIAIMRFLNDHQVPYVLPLKGAFFVDSNEALPPRVTRLLRPARPTTRAAAAAAAKKSTKKVAPKKQPKPKKLTAAQKKAADLKKRREKAAAAKAKKAAAAKKASAIQSKKKPVKGKAKPAPKKKAPAARGGRKPNNKKAASSSSSSSSSSEEEDEDESDDDTSSDSDDSSDATDSSASTSSDEASEEAEDEGEVKLPKFLAIAKEDALDSDATLFLVTELCDGDVEGITERAEPVTRRVAFCVSSAITELHRLGLVHLDIKPSNILFAYERPGTTVASMAEAGSEAHVSTIDATPLRRGPFSPTGAGGGGGGGGHAAIKFYLSDFGNCQIVGPSYSDVVHDSIGTYEYMDATALEFKVCSRATDCFSLGCTIHELLSGQRLFADCAKKACQGTHGRLCYLSQAKKASSRQPLPLPAGGGGRGSTSGRGMVAADGELLAHAHTSLMARVAGWLCNTDTSSRLSAAGCKNYLINALGVSPAVVPPSPIPGGVVVRSHSVSQYVSCSPFAPLLPFHPNGTGSCSIALTAAGGPFAAVAAPPDSETKMRHLGSHAVPVNGGSGHATPAGGVRLDYASLPPTHGAVSGGNGPGVGAASPTSQRLRFLSAASSLLGQT